ncbi:hypothetical protein ELS19_05130 [Halogeometricum borinquense]|uniref:Uncharacterized protein n=1 Tax=Halogeometricum borinquense TaxID=60847 RepID=A0A482T985_9EURY|nr:hypothetical protein [Halogeometricum borinquense]RYJ13407.1 hypothetical protein ELS19_05130 [Halogeometricum borinquense]
MTGGRGRETERECRHERKQEHERAQTTMDFTVGISIFLLVVVFVVAFVPGIFEPFEGADQTQTADRLGTSLASDALGEPGTPAALNATCTWSFFRQMQTGTDTTADCGFDATTDTVAATLGVTDVAVNVTVFDDGSVAELDSPDGIAGTKRELRAGPPVPTSRGVATARRAVLLDDRTRQLVVRVW